MKSEITNKKEQIIIDASNCTLGRIASYAAKQSLLGKSIIIVNCNNALLTGNRSSIINEYDIMRKKGGAILKGPFFPRTSSRIFKRTVRGMLNYKQQRGLDAFKRIICFDSIPAEYQNSKKISLDRSIKTKSMTLKELSKEI